MYPHLKHPEKYLGESKVITARSGWEISFISKFLDRRTDIIGWSSEDFCIPYFYDVDKRYHRYFPDFLVKFKNNSGTISENLIEIKPFSETIPPVKPKRITKGYVDKVHTYIKNTNKWDAARAWCVSQRNVGRPIEFIILTERDLGGIII